MTVTARGSLRVYLGMAPGAGKTYAMLGEGQRRKARGSDVVVAYVETYGRLKTEEMLRGLEVVPRRTITYRGATFTEIADVDPSTFGFAVAAHPQDAGTAWFVPGVADEQRPHPGLLKDPGGERVVAGEHRPALAPVGGRLQVPDCDPRHDRSSLVATTDGLTPFPILPARALPR